MAEHSFHGCKAALFIGEKLLIILRDDKPDIHWPNLWDFPGGGREGDETPEETLFREIHEEVGLTITTEDLVWRRTYQAAFDAAYAVLFFVARLPAEAEADIVFGDEGQDWKLVTVDAYFEMDQTIPSYSERLRDWYRETA